MTGPAQAIALQLLLGAFKEMTTINFLSRDKTFLTWWCKVGDEGVERFYNVFEVSWEVRHKSQGKILNSSLSPW